MYLIIIHSSLDKKVDNLSLISLLYISSIFSSIPFCSNGNSKSLLSMFSCFSFCFYIARYFKLIILLNVAYSHCFGFSGLPNFSICLHKAKDTSDITSSTSSGQLLNLTLQILRSCGSYSFQRFSQISLCMLFTN